MFNSNSYCAGEVPGTWEELLSPAWNGKIVIREPMDSGTMKTIFTGLIWSLGGWEHDHAAGFEFLRRERSGRRGYF